MRLSKSAKVTPADVLEIRRRYWDGNESQREIAWAYGLSVVQVGRIVRGESWSRTGGISGGEVDRGVAPRGELSKEEEAVIAGQSPEIQESLRRLMRMGTKMQVVSEEGSVPPPPPVEELDPEGGE